MKNLLLSIAFFTLAQVQAQVNFEIVNLEGDTVFTVRQTEKLANDQQNINHWSGSYDSLGLVSKGILEIFNLEVAAANAYAEFELTKAAALNLRQQIEGFRDTSYFDATQSRISAPFIQKTEQPNFLIRVGDSFERYKATIAGNGFLTLELQVYDEANSRWENANPRDMARLILISNKSLRVLPLDQTGEQLDFYLVPSISGNTRSIFEAKKSDGTTARMTHFKNN